MKTNFEFPFIEITDIEKINIVTASFGGFEGDPDGFGDAGDLDAWINPGF